VSRFVLVALLALCALADALVLLRAAWAILTAPDRAWSIILMHDRLANVAANDDSGDLISTRAYLARQAGKRWGRWLADALDHIEPRHCLMAFMSDLKRKGITP